MPLEKNLATLPFARANKQQKLAIVLDLQKRGAFYNHGDNPIYKKMATIYINNRRAEEMDHRTHIFDRFNKLFLARNWDDVLQRDLKASTFYRASCILLVNTIFTAVMIRHVRKFLPIGRFGIRNVFQTSFYHNFGPVGLIGLGAYASTVLYTEWRTLRFTADKFYADVFEGNRLFFENDSEDSVFGSYLTEKSYFADQARQHEAIQILSFIANFNPKQHQQIQVPDDCEVIEDFNVYPQ